MAPVTEGEGSGKALEDIFWLWTDVISPIQNAKCKMQSDNSKSKEKKRSFYSPRSFYILICNFAF